MYMKPLFKKLPIFCYPPELEEKIENFRKLGIEFSEEGENDEDYDISEAPINLNLIEQYLESKTGKTVIYLASGFSLYCAMGFKDFEKLIKEL